MRERERESQCVCVCVREREQEKRERREWRENESERERGRLTDKDEPLRGTGSAVGWPKATQRLTFEHMVDHTVKRCHAGRISTPPRHLHRGGRFGIKWGRWLPAEIPHQHCPHELPCLHQHCMCVSEGEGEGEEVGGRMERGERRISMFDTSWNASHRSTWPAARSSAVRGSGIAYEVASKPINTLLRHGHRI